MKAGTAGFRFEISMSFILGTISSFLLLSVLIFLTFIEEAQETVLTKILAPVGLLFAAFTLGYAYFYDENFLMFALAELAAVVGYLFSHTSEKSIT